MKSTTKTTLLFIMLFNTVFVSGAPNTVYEGQSSRSKEKQIKDCTDELYEAFKMKEPKDNFLYAFLHINDLSFTGLKAFTPTTYNYYSELLDIGMDSNVPYIMSPLEYCVVNHECYIDDCLLVIKRAGCEEETPGVVCLRILYHKWKTEDRPYQGAIPGTRDISDAELKKAYFRGSGNLENFQDKNLLYDYYSQNGSSFSDDESVEGSSESQILDHKQRENDLYKARSVRYGIGEASYAQICQEYKRRGGLLKPYDDYYVQTIHKILKRKQ